MQRVEVETDNAGRLEVELTVYMRLDIAAREGTAEDVAEEVAGVLEARHRGRSLEPCGDPPAGRARWSATVMEADVVVDRLRFRVAREDQATGS